MSRTTRVLASESWSGGRLKASPGGPGSWWRGVSPANVRRVTAWGGCSGSEMASFLRSVQGKKKTLNSESNSEWLSSPFLVFQVSADKLDSITAFQKFFSQASYTKLASYRRAIFQALEVRLEKGLFICFRQGTRQAIYLYRTVLHWAVRTALQK